MIDLHHLTASAVLDRLAHRLWEVRQRAGLSQKQAAERSGIGVRTISSFETRARVHTIKVAQLLCLLKAYDVTVEEFFGEGWD